MKITLSTPLSPATLASMCGGCLVLRDPTAPVLPVSSICTDSREADRETLLSAIRGERVDGHRFLPAAAQAGCVSFLCERLPDGWDDWSTESPMGDCPAAAILVPDTVRAFSALATARRQGELESLRIVAITGSVGKTTTKECTAAVLSEGLRLYKKDGNFNSTIGLPLSFLEVIPATDAAVLEMGMSARGEIATMSEAVSPDIAVVTNIGSSHLEHLGSRENIACAKLEIARGLRAGGILLYNVDEPLLTHLGQDFPDERPLLPTTIHALSLTLADTPGADYAARRMAPTNGGMRFDLHTPDGIMPDLFIPAPGEHMVWAAAFAAVVGLLCGLDEHAIRRGLTAYRPAHLRGSRRAVAGVTFLEDCYNAAPESMRAALRVLDTVATEAAAKSPSARRIAILGDMKELGSDTVSLHRAVGAAVARHAVDHLVTVGALAAHIAHGAVEAGLPADRITVTANETAVSADTYSDIASQLAPHLHPGDILLFKASRSMKLEKMAEALVAELAKEVNRL